MKYTLAFAALFLSLSFVTAQSTTATVEYLKKTGRLGE